MSSILDKPAGSSIENPAAPIEGLSPPVEDSIPEGWKRDKKGRLYVGARGRAGVIYRQGDESIEDAIDRDQRSRENGHPPKSKPKTQKAPAPTRKTSKELEAALTETLQAPAMIAGLRGDEWVANHLYQEAPVLARNLVAAAEHNPKMRERLEQIAGGETAFGQFVMQMMIANALVAYALPPLVYYLGDRLPGGARMRESFHVPEKPKKAPVIDLGPIDLDGSDGAAAAAAASGPPAGF